MKAAKIFGVLGVLGLGTAMAAPTQADDLGWYMGAGLGHSQSDFDNGSGLNAAMGGGSTTSSNTDRAFKVFGGYKFNPYFALEAGYFDLGQFGVVRGAQAGNFKYNGVNADLVGFLPLTKRFSLYAQGGYQFGYTSDNFTSAPSTASSNSGGYNYGVGLQFEITPSVLLRGEWDDYHMNDGLGDRTDPKAVFVSLVFPFGEKHEAPAPAPVAAAPAPAPEPVAAPAPAPAPVAAAPERITLDAETLFGLNKSELRPAGKDALKGLAAHLNSVDYKSVKVMGYTDRLGSDAYNKKLSQRRAESVKAYLVEQGVPASKISAVGMGKADPVTKDSCKGKKATKKLVQCLQPDRRVVVEVSGTRQQ